METIKRRVPLKPDLFEFIGKDNEIQLIGSQCAACGEKFFPQKTACPGCSAREMNQVLLSKTGVIRTFAVVRQTAPTWRGPLPYIIVMVTLDDGVKVTSHLAGGDPDNVRIGAKVVTVAEKLWETEEGEEVIAHMFKEIN